MTKTLALLLICLAAAAPARAQQADAPEPDPVEGLRALAVEAAELDDAVMRIYVESTLAQALWERDKPAARRLIERVVGGYAALPAHDLLHDRDAVLRSNLTNHVGYWLGRDAEFVRKVALATPEPPAPEPGTVFAPQSPRGRLLLEIAEHDHEADGAAALVRESLRGGMPVTIASALEEIARRDRALANDLAREAIREVERRGGTLFELGFLMPYVFASEPAVIGEEDDDDEPRPAVDADLAAAHLEAVRAAVERYLAAVDAARAAKQRPRAAWFTARWATSYYAHMQRYLPAFERYDLESAPAARGLVDRLAALMDPKDREMADLFADPGTTSEHVNARAAQAGDAAEREHFLMHAYQRAEREDKLEEALAIAEKMADPHNRASCVDWARAGLANRAAAGKRFDEALAHASAIAEAPVRAQTMARLAESIVAAGDAKRGVELLERAEQSVARDATASVFDVARARFDLATAYASLLTSKTPGVTEDRAFEVMAAAVKAANAAYQAGPDRMRHPDPKSPFAAMGYFNDLRLSEPIGRLAHRDPDRAAALAGQIAMKPLALLARIEVAKAGG